jgi:hypothetical protein
MSKDKALIITKLSNTYEDENNAESIKIYLAKYINNINLKECSVWLGFINQEGLGDQHELTEYLTEYSNDYYVVEKPMGQIFTYEPGSIEMWIKVLHSPTQMVAKTNEVIYTIKPHKEIDDTIPEQEMSFIDSLTMKIDKVTAKVEEIDEYVSELQEGEVLLVQPSNDEAGK